ncbi:MAG TPA: TRAM domain-containing protein, partial [Bacteroidetes bacterium]|nr:TRAM domain-containing protein [Bacteroidota bacterium]
MKKGEILDIRIEQVAFGSEGIGRVDGQVVFVPGVLPGERVRVRVVQKRRDYLRARVEEWLET